MNLHHIQQVSIISS